MSEFRAMLEDPEMCRLIVWMGLFILAMVTLAFYPRNRRK